MNLNLVVQLPDWSGMQNLPLRGKNGPMCASLSIFLSFTDSKGASPGHFDYRITPHTPHTFIHCSTNFKEGVRVINGYMMPQVRGRVEQGLKWRHLSSVINRTGTGIGPMMSFFVRMAT